MGLFMTLWPDWSGMLNIYKSPDNIKIFECCIEDEMACDLINCLSYVFFNSVTRYERKD